MYMYVHQSHQFIQKVLCRKKKQSERGRCTLLVWVCGASARARVCGGWGLTVLWQREEEKRDDIVCSSVCFSALGQRGGGRWRYLREKVLLCRPHGKPIFSPRCVYIYLPRQRVCLREASFASTSQDTREAAVAPLIDVFGACSFVLSAPAVCC